MFIFVIIIGFVVFLYIYCVVIKISTKLHTFFFILNMLSIFFCNGFVLITSPDVVFLILLFFLIYFSCCNMFFLLLICICLAFFFLDMMCCFCTIIFFPLFFVQHVYVLLHSVFVENFYSSFNILYNYINFFSRSTLPTQFS